MVYAHDLKSCLARDVGSSPTPGTKKSAFADFLVTGEKVLGNTFVGTRSLFEIF
jgi:hypothetical protein